MTDEPSTPDFILGKLSAQVRELIHQVNNISSKVDYIGTEAVKMSALPQDIQALKNAVSALEATENKRTGAASFLKWLFSSPIPAWALAVAGAVWVYLGGVK